jgi:hypothetical protein
MRAVIDDFPSLGVSRLRASHYFQPTDTHATVAFPGYDDLTFTLPLQHIHFPSGGGWSFFVCPCGQRARTLRLRTSAAPDDPTPITPPELACHRCLRSRGYRNRIEMFPRYTQRVALTAPRRMAMLAAPSLQLNQPARGMNKRGFAEARLRRSLALARQAALEEHDRTLARALRTQPQPRS